MGGNFRPLSQEEIDERNKRFEKIKIEREQKLERLAMKCATIAIDNIVTDIIRPGPKPEERECYDVANEIRAYQARIIEEIKKALKVEAEDYDGVVKLEYREAK